MEGDFDFVCSKIDEDQEFFNSISQEIWRTPELGYNEVNAHECLSNALQKYGFHVQKHYHLDTAFKGEYESSKGSGPTIAILLEYDALPEIGHACGHNLIAEAGLAAAVSVKSMMEKDPSLGGKLVVMGTPAEESKGGKIKLIEKGAFNGIDVAMMTHPSRFSSALPPFLCNLRGRVQFMGKESHAAAYPWKGVNALDAAVICYNSLSCLRQQLKPTHRIHKFHKAYKCGDMTLYGRSFQTLKISESIYSAVRQNGLAFLEAITFLNRSPFCFLITVNVAEGGIALNIIPAKSVLKVAIRTPTMGELNLLRKQVENCIRGAATSTNCEVTSSFDEAECYQSVISNKVLANLYREYFEKLAGGRTVALLLEYDALPGIGHACGHNLISEAGLAAAMAVKKVMEQDETLSGKLVVLGTPAEEAGGGKISLMELGAFKGIDAALMVHPSRSIFHSNPVSSSRMKCSVQFNGKEAHSAVLPWEGKNALDAAVACYNNLAMLRQQLKPNCRIHVIITEGGVVTNIIPARSKMEISLRAPTLGVMKQMKSQVEACMKGAATVTGCTVDYRFDESNSYHNLISNQVISKLYQTFGERLGMTFRNPDFAFAWSTDMGNVSHVIPSMHAFYGIPSEHSNHTKGFTEASGSPAAQPSTLTAAKAMALTCLALLRDNETMEEARKEFLQDVLKDMEH